MIHRPCENEEKDPDLLKRTKAPKYPPYLSIDYRSDRKNSWSKKAKNTKAKASDCRSDVVVWNLWTRKKTTQSKR